MRQLSLLGRVLISGGPHQRTNGAICRSLNFKQAAGFERRRSCVTNRAKSQIIPGYPGIGEKEGREGDGHAGEERPLGASSRKGNNRRRFLSVFLPSPFSLCVGLARDPKVGALKRGGIHFIALRSFLSGSSKQDFFICFLAASGLRRVFSPKKEPGRANPKSSSSA